MNHTFGLSTPELCGPRLRVEFTFDRDRFGHSVWLMAGSSQQRMLTSVEGATEDRWPASPVIQQISPQRTRQEQHFLAGVGMACDSHWSLSVLACGENIQFDVACRVKQHPVALVSTYRIDEGLEGFLAEEAVAIDVGCCTCLLTGLSVGDHNSFLTLKGGQVKVSALCGENRYPVTVRWQYRISLPSSTSNVSPGNSQAQRRSA